MYDINKIVLSGQIKQIESFKTKSDRIALNVYVKSVNKYEDINPCVAYGEMANSILKNYKVGTNVIVIGRNMSITYKESKNITNRTVIEKIGEELYVENNDTTDKK